MTASGIPFSNLPRVPADDDAWNLPIAPPGNYEAATLARMARSDFETAWDARVERSKTDEDFGGGNFMFSLLAMVYLELACRTAAADTSGLVLSQFSDRLAEIEPRYFRPLSGPVGAPSGFELPSRPGVAPDQHMLALIFDLARNGQSHMYQQICVSLEGATRAEDLLTLALGGVSNRPPLAVTRAALAPPAEHLRLERTPKGHLALTVLPDVLFVHVNQAARRSSLFSHGLVPTYFQRRRQKSKGRLVCDFTSAELEAALGR